MAKWIVKYVDHASFTLETKLFVLYIDNIENSWKYKIESFSRIIYNGEEKSFVKARKKVLKHARKLLKKSLKQLDKP